MPLTFFEDPGHGWLQVSLTDLQNVGLAPSDISKYSYRWADWFYLEEDCDAPKFLNAYRAKHNGNDPEIKHVYQEHTFIRNLPRIKGRAI